jgi:hypothetical protein
VGEHVPDRLGEPAGEVGLGDPGASLFAKTVLRPLVTLSVDGMRVGVNGCLDEQP